MGKNWNSDRLYFLGFRINEDSDCSHKVQRRLLLGRKVMINLDSVLKSRDITLLTKVRLVKTMVFPLVTYRCERPQRKLSTEELMLLNCGAREDSRVTWTVRRSNQPVLKENNPEYSLKGLMWKLKLLNSGHLMAKSQFIRKDSDVWKIEGKRRRGH